MLTCAEDMELRHCEVGDWRLSDAEFILAFRLPKGTSESNNALAFRNPMPRENRIRFDEVEHVYTVDGIRVPRSVTALIHNYCAPFDCRSAIAAMKAGKDWEKKRAIMEAQGCLTSDDEIMNMWQANGVVQRARGQLLHFQIEQILNGRSIELPHSPELQQAQKITAFFLRNCGFSIFRTEVYLFHCGLRLAGAPDLLCMDSKGDLVIVDWKRVSSITFDATFRSMKPPWQHLPDSNYWHYALQLNLYAYILETEYGMAVSSIYLAVVHPTQVKPRVIEVPRLPNEIRDLVSYEISNGNATPPQSIDAAFELMTPS